MSSVKSQKLLNSLTMAKRAGRLITGFDETVKNTQAGKIKLILTAADISPKTKKELEFKLRDSKCGMIPTEVTIAEYETALSAKAAVIGIADDGFAKAAKKIIQSE